MYGLYVPGSDVNPFQLGLGQLGATMNTRGSNRADRKVGRNSARLHELTFISNEHVWLLLTRFNRNVKRGSRIQNLSGW